ncbi:MAG: LPD7 domain-containing protein [Candidatus Nitrotoga sp.]
MRLNQPGWKEYCALRETQKLAKAHDIIKLQKRHETERTQLYTKLKTERAAALAGDWKGRGTQRNVLVSLTAIKQAAAKRELQEQHKKERAQLQAQYKALPLYKEWRDQPRIISPVEQDKSGELYLEINQTITLSLILKSLSRTEDWRGHFTYAAGGKDLFRDEGRILAVLDENSDEAIAATLLVAREKFGSTLTLTGSPAFQQRVVAVAVAQGIAVKFFDPALEEMRLGLVEEKRRAVSTHKPQPLVPSNQPAQQGQAPRAAASAAEIPTEQTVEVVPTPQPLRAAQWIVSQHKREVRPHQTGDGSVEYTVSYVADDAVVVNHGRDVATYQLPPNLVLHAGQKIVINKFGAVVIPPRRTEVEAGKGRGD